MALEGELRVHLLWRDGCIERVRLESTRPDVAAILLHGRTPAELRAAVPTLFAVCGRSQAAACELALRAAAGHPPDAAAVARWSAEVAVETLRDGTWRVLLEWPRRLGEAPTPQALQAARRAMAPGPADADALQDIAAALFGMPASAWLALSTPAELDAWLAGSHGATARFVRLAFDDGRRQPEHGVTTALLPAHDHAACVAECLPDAEAEADFAHQPTWRGAPAETGALARQQDDALVAPLLDGGAPRAAARFVARLRELARLLAGEVPTLAGVLPAPAGDGVAWVENGRGLLVHQLRLREGRSRAYRIVAPTEWNFHPDGALVRALRGSPAADRDAARRHALRLMDSLDPCVACHLEFDDA